MHEPRGDRAPPAAWDECAAVDSRLPTPDTTTAGTVRGSWDSADGHPLGQGLDGDREGA